MGDLVLRRDQVRHIDRLAIEDYGIPGIVLMENAGRGVADTLCRLGIDGPVVVCCGKGNNAGDGLVLARHLDLRQFPVRVDLWCDPKKLTGDAATNYQILSRTDVPIRVAATESGVTDEKLLEADWIVDALLGTGATGAPRPPLGAVLRRLNSRKAKRLAIDVPSGVDCDTGAVAGAAFRADHTCTFVAAKPGLLVPPGRDYAGRVHVLDIGAPRKLIRQVTDR